MQNDTFGWFIVILSAANSKNFSSKNCKKIVRIARIFNEIY